MSNLQLKPTLVSVDTGGTFTDVILRRGDTELRHKLPSTPDDPARAVLEGVAAVMERLGDAGTPQVIHGSTVATNALLEGQTADAVFVTTAGFEDTLHIARQNRPALYAQVARRPAPPLPRAHCVGVRERLGPGGEVQEPLVLDGLADRVAEVAAGSVEALAISLLHSYANPDHERAVADHLQAAFPDAHITVSSSLTPEFREYERAATVVGNAVVAPRMGAYVRTLQGALGDRLEIMSSSGGSMTADETCAEPVHTVLSGPAGGVVGALQAARAAGFDRILTFDMGGTSTDVSLCDGDITVRREARIAGLPLRIPALDIHTVGAGGGSVAWVDAGGALRVGPASAGAVPGPACYGKGGTRATVTDANLVLGRLAADGFLGGQMTLRPELAETAVADVAAALGADLLETAAGIVRIAEATMARALKVISVERGFDAREFSLVTFGGAGGVHACALADELGVETVIVPPSPGLLSAVGMQHAPAVFSQARAVLAEAGAQLPRPSDMETRARDRLSSQGFAAKDQTLRWTADLRYAGQSHEIEVPLERGVDAFHQAHERLYGYRTERAVELVTVRLRAEGRPRAWDIRPRLGTHAEFSGPRVAREALAAGARGRGPCLVTEYSSATWIPDGWMAEVVDSGALVIRRPQERS